MPNIKLTEEKVVNIIEQLKGNIHLQHVILDLLSKQLPENYFKEWVKEMYHEHVDTRPYYYVEHVKFKQHKAYCLTRDEVEEYIKTWHGGHDLADFTRYTLGQKIRNGTPLHGFTIVQRNKKEDNNEG